MGMAAGIMIVIIGVAHNIYGNHRTANPGTLMTFINDTGLPALKPGPLLRTGFRR
jgi:hypothetical protein